MNEKPKQISDLAAGAHLEVERQTKQPSPAKPRLGTRGRGILATCFAAGVAIAAYAFAGPWILGFSDSALRQDLLAVVAAARDDIEGSRRQTGTLPSSIGNIALAMVVEYDRRAEGYRLVASDGYHVIEMDAAGQVTESIAAR